MKTSAQLKDIFLSNSRKTLSKTQDGRINPEKLKAFAMGLKVPGGDAYGWNEYLSAEALKDPVDFHRVFHEMLVITAQNAGYLYRGENGNTEKWAVKNSGAKALLEYFDDLKAKGLLGDAPDMAQLDASLQDKPLSGVRQKIMNETLGTAASFNVHKIEAQTMQYSGGYRFDMKTVETLSEMFPTAYGEDPFRKKAVLLCLMVAGHLRSRGVQVDLQDLIVPADYRIPETLNAAGVIEMSDELVSRIEADELFNEDDPAVKAVRAASVVAVEEICKQSGLAIDQIDLALWMAARDGTLDKLKAANTDCKVASKHLACETMRF